MGEKIDVVILWVDGEDPKWLEKKENYRKSEAEDSIRYRDYGTLKYLFRSIDQYMPWVNKIFFITDNQVPDWLDTTNDKLCCINHTDYIPDEYLPTFNSNVIELNLFRIEELSEKFIIFNDDTFANRNLNVEDFFLGDDILDVGLYNRIAPVEDFAHTLVNNTMIINKYFSKKKSMEKNWKKQFSFNYGFKFLNNLLFLPWKDITGYINPHFTQPHFKSTWISVIEKEKKRFERVNNNRFRENSDLNHWVFRYWLLEEGRYQPQHRNFGKYLLISDQEKIRSEILSGKSKIVCINDSEGSFEEFDEWKNNLLATFQEKFPKPCRFEKNES